MNLKQLILTTLTTSILLSVLPRNHFALGEVTKNNQKANYHKHSTVDRDIAYEQNINHIVIGSRIITQFAPRDSKGARINLNKLASDLGYDHFNWVSYVEQDPYGIADTTGKQLSTPYNDPPAGGYQYDNADRLPFYWDVVDCHGCNQRHHIQNHNNSQQFELVFEDSPADYRLQPGETIEFMTSLVGVKSIDTAQNQTEWDVLHTFRWELSNPRKNYSQVSVVDRNVDLTNLSSTLIDNMLVDGAILPNSVRVSNQISDSQ